MSGIYIPNMNVPKTCGGCLRVGWNYVFECRINDVEEDERLSSCPLIPVPDHGDLIERDKLRSIMFIGEQCLYSWDEIEDAIDYIPAVISADMEV